MRHIIKILIAMTVMVPVLWYSVLIFVAIKPPLVALPVADHVPTDLPDTPEEWRGRIDYRALDLRLIELSLQPEMAGLAVAVVEDGEVRFVRTYGVADRDTLAPVTPDTLFRWASVSKTVTGTLAATLANDKALYLDRPVSSWQTSLHLPGDAEKRITLAQLLAHQTGLTKNAYDEKLEDGERPSVPPEP